MRDTPPVVIADARSFTVVHVENADGIHVIDQVVNLVTRYPAPFRGLVVCRELSADNEAAEDQGDNPLRPVLVDAG